MASSKHILESCWKVLMIADLDSRPMHWVLTVTAMDEAGAIAKASSIFPARTTVEARLSHLPMTHVREPSEHSVRSLVRRRHDDYAESR